jgi:hypothetical protein
MKNTNYKFTKIWYIYSQKFSSVHTFRRVAELGLPKATPELYKEYTDLTMNLLSSDKYLSNRKKFIEEGWVEKTPNFLLKNTINTFNSAIDSASLIFAHSILDAVAFEYCQLIAEDSPMSFKEKLSNKKLSLSDISNNSYEDLLKLQLNKFLEDFERESMLKKFELLFYLCKPPEVYEPLENYKYDNKRISELDKLRHDYVHGVGIVNKLPNGEEDITYLEKTLYFFTALIQDTFGYKIDQNSLIEFWKNK